MHRTVSQEGVRSEKEKQAAMERETSRDGGPGVVEMSRGELWRGSWLQVAYLKSN